MEETFKAYCKTCQAADDCRRAFGKYYEGKSRGGVPFPGYSRRAPLQMFTSNNKGTHK